MLGDFALLPEHDRLPEKLGLLDEPEGRELGDLPLLLGGGIRPLEVAQGPDDLGGERLLPD